VVVYGHRQNFLGMFLSYNMLVQVLKDLQAVTFSSPGTYQIRQHWKKPIINKEKCLKIKYWSKYSHKTDRGCNRKTQKVTYWVLLFICFTQYTSNQTKHGG
jgi:hypothetical protein